MTSWQLYLVDPRQMEIKMNDYTFVTATKMCSLCSRIPLMSKLLYTKVNILHTSIQCHNNIMTFKNDKHSTVLCTRLFSLCKHGGTNENNRSYLRIIDIFGRIIGKFLRIAE